MKLVKRRNAGRECWSSGRCCWCMKRFRRIFKRSVSSGGRSMLESEVSLALTGSRRDASFLLSRTLPAWGVPTGRRSRIFALRLQKMLQANACMLTLAVSTDNRYGRLYFVYFQYRSAVELQYRRVMSFVLMSLL